MSHSLNYEDGDGALSRVVAADGHAHTLDPRMPHEVRGMSIFGGESAIDHALAGSHLRGNGGIVKDQPCANAVNHGRNGGHGFSRDMKHECAFSGIISACADFYRSKAKIPDQSRSAPLLDGGYALAFPRDQRCLRGADLRRTGRGGLRAAYRMVRTTHNRQRS